MPEINAHGVSVDHYNQRWFDLVRGITQECNTIHPGCCVALSDGTIVFDFPATEVAANECGHAAVWAMLQPENEPGVVDTFGRRFPGAGIDVRSHAGGMGPDGAYALKVARNSYGPWDVIEPSGARWRLTDGDASDIQLLGDGEAIWREGGTLRSTIGVGLRTPQGEWYNPRAVKVRGRWTLLYQSATGGALVLGDRIIARGVNFFRPHVREIAPDLFRFRWGLDEGGVRCGQIDLTAAQIDAQPVLSLAPPAADPSPVPQPKPEPKPVSIKNQIAVVEQVRRKYGQRVFDEQRKEWIWSPPLGSNHVQFLIDVAKATGGKLFRKDGGAHVTLPNGVNVSMDILIVQGEDGPWWVDILSDAEGQAAPAWDAHPNAGGEFVDVASLGTQPEPQPKPDPAPPQPDYSARLAAVEAALKAIEAAQAEERAAVLQLGEAVRQLRERPVPPAPDLSGYAKKGDAVEVEGSISIGAVARGSRVKWKGSIV